MVRREVKPKLAKQLINYTTKYTFNQIEELFNKYNIDYIRVTIEAPYRVLGHNGSVYSSVDEYLDYLTNNKE